MFGLDDFAPTQVTPEATPTGSCEGASDRTAHLEQRRVFLPPERPRRQPSLSEQNDAGRTDSKANQASDELPPIAVLTPIRHQGPRSRFRLLQQWEGEVLEVGEDYFTARLADLTGDAEDEEAELPIEDLSPSDLPRLRPGAIFYWSIGYETTKWQERQRKSVIHFRRLPAWTRNDLERARCEARSLRDSLKWT